MSQRTAFDLLSLPPSLTVPQEEVDAAWRAASQIHHPDAPSSGDREAGADLVNQARARLSKPAGRLQEWLQARKAPPPPRAASLPDEMMALFSRVNAALGEADKALGLNRGAQTALARSLLTAQSLRAQKRVQEQLGEITLQTARIARDQFVELERESLETGDFDNAYQVLGTLKFLEKWEKECQRRLVELIALV